MRSLRRCQGLCRGPENPRGREGGRRPAVSAQLLPPQGLCRLPSHPLHHPLGSLPNSHHAIPFSWTNIGECVQGKAKFTPCSFCGKFSLYMCVHIRRGKMLRYVACGLHRVPAALIYFRNNISNNSTNSPIFNQVLIFFFFLKRKQAFLDFKE